MADWAEQFETFATYYWLTATLGILVLLVVSLLAPLRKWIVEGFPQTRKNWIILSGILLACSLFCFTHSSPQTRMASDEQLQQSVASNFYHLKRADYCNEGNFFDGEISCTKFQPAIYPKLYSYFLSVY